MMLLKNRLTISTAGALDELNPDLFAITDRLEFWKKKAVSNMRLKDSKSRGTIAGEGTAFFSLSRMKSEKSFARISSVKKLFLNLTISRK